MMSNPENKSSSSSDVSWSTKSSSSKSSAVATDSATGGKATPQTTYKEAAGKKVDERQPENRESSGKQSISRLSVGKQSISRLSVGKQSVSKGSLGKGSVGKGSVGKGSVGKGSVGKGSLGKGSIGKGSVGKGSVGKGSVGRGFVGRGAINNRNSVTVFNKTEMKLNALAGVVNGDQAASYDIDDLVFVNHNGNPWPARVEDPSNVIEKVTRFEYAVFLYGIHQRKVMRLKDVFLYEQNLESFEGKSDSLIFNIAMGEIRTNPDCNLKKIPSHKKKPIRYLLKSRSHTFLDRYLGGPAIQMVLEESDSETSTEVVNNPFYAESFVTYDSALGYFTIISSFLFMVYMTWWIIVMPFLEPNYHSLIENYFPNPSQNLVYPITGGTIVSCSVICYVLTQLER